MTLRIFVYHSLKPTHDSYTNPKAEGNLKPKNKKIK